MNLENLKSSLADFFTEFYGEDSLAILFILAITFLLGLLFGSLSRGKRIRRLTKMVKERDNDLITLRSENGAFKEKLEVSEENLQKVQNDYETTNTLLGEMQTDRNRIHRELQETKLLVQDFQKQNTAHDEKIDELNERILDLRLKNDSLNQKLAEQPIITPPDDSGSTSTNTTTGIDRISNLEDKLDKLASENITLRSDLIDIKDQSGISSDNSLAAIKARLEQLELENDRLQSDLSGLKNESPPVLTEKIELVSVEKRQAGARSALNAAFGTRIKRVNAYNKDNLKMIDGVGPFIENKLNDIGIYTFEQISQLDDELIGHITDAIQFFPGRIQRDGWVQQAKKLMG